MIEHIWSVLCTRSLIDKRSNNLSLIEVVERLSVTGAPPNSVAPVGMELVSMWARSVSDQPARARAKVRLLAPDGVQIGDTIPYEVDLTSHARSRNISIMGGLPIRGSGNHLFLVEVEDGDRWVTVAKVPLEVIIQAEEAPSTPSSNP